MIHKIMHFISKYSLVFILLIIGFSIGCSSGDDIQTVPVDGKITVADSVDNSKDYAGIGITIIKKDSATAAADTLFNATTNKEGLFSGTASFPERRQYLMLISRNGQNIGQAGVILAAGDTVHITAELPGFRKTLSIKSREQDALNTYQRVEQSFRRIAAFAQTGKLKGDSLTTEIQKWPDIYWQVYEKNKGTIGGNLAAQRTIDLLSGWDKAGMMKKVRRIEHDDDLVFVAASYGKDYMAETKGLDYTLSYLDTLKSNAQSKESQIRIQIEKINLLYDSARVEQARSSLQSFEQEFKEDQAAQKWAKSIKYDLNYLAPGDAIPDFSFMENGKEISRENLKGHPYLLEITPLSNPLYQRQYDRTMVIYSIYKNYDFKIITIPLDKDQTTINAFFENRAKVWPVANAGAFNTQDLIKKFNIKSAPTRFLVNEQGRIAHRYIAQEFEDVIKGIQEITNRK